MALIATSKDIDLIYSSDDAAETGKGYYLQRVPGGETSQSFKTQAEAQRAFDMRNHPGAITWTK